MVVGGGGGCGRGGGGSARTLARREFHYIKTLYMFICDSHTLYIIWHINTIYNLSGKDPYMTISI